jgi:hypothetical protein
LIANMTSEPHPLSGCIRSFLKALFRPFRRTSFRKYWVGERTCAARRRMMRTLWGRQDAGGPGNDEPE